MSCVTVKAVDSQSGVFPRLVLQIMFWTNVYIFIFSCGQIVSLNHYSMQFIIFQILKAPRKSIIFPDPVQQERVVIGLLNL